MLEPYEEGGAMAEGGGAMPIDEAEELALALALAMEPEDEGGAMAEGGAIALADAEAEAIALA